MNVLQVNPRNVFIGKSVDNHIVLQCLYIQYIAMSDAVIASVSANTNTLCVSTLKVRFLLSEQLVVTFGFGNRFFKALGGNGLYQ